MLGAQIETRLHERAGRALTNFDRTLPAPQSELAGQILKDPYNFEFLTTYDAAVERYLHKGLLEHLKDFNEHAGKLNSTSLQQTICSGIPRIIQP